MRIRAAALGVLVGVCMCAMPALAQKKLQDMDARLKNVEADLDVLKEFIQDQSKQQAATRKQLDELTALKQDLAKTDKKAEALALVAKQTAGEVTELGKRVGEDEKRLATVEDELKKKLKFWGQIRVRPEYRSNNGDFNSMLDEDQNLSAGQRVRIGMSAAPFDGFVGRVTLQDARSWGVNSGDADPADPMRLYEGYIDATLDKDAASLKLGRQEWAFGAQRMIGKSDWSHAGRSFDGLDLTLKYENYVKADVLYSIIDERNASQGKDEVFGGVYAVSPYVEGMTFDGYFLYLHDDREGGMRKVGTLGARSAGNLPVHKAFFFDAEVALQFGTVTESPRVGDPKTGAVETSSDGVPLSVDNSHFAVMYYLEAGYELPVGFPLAVSALAHIASGDGNSSPNPASGNDQSTGFVSLFPTRHSILGRMDIFSMQNIQDLAARVRTEPIKGLSFLSELHYFSLYADTGPLPAGKTPNSSLVEPTDSALGVEWDLEGKYQFNPAFALSAGFGLFFPGQAIVDRVETQRDEPGDDDPEQLTTYRYPAGDTASWLFVQADLLF
jgi:hypothetical protein